LHWISLLVQPLSKLLPVSAAPIRHQDAVGPLLQSLATQISTHPGVESHFATQKAYAASKLPKDRLSKRSR